MPSSLLGYFFSLDVTTELNDPTMTKTSHSDQTYGNVNYLIMNIPRLIIPCVIILTNLVGKYAKPKNFIGVYWKIFF